MADKMMRMAGRDESGRARALEVNNGMLRTNVADNCLQSDYAIDQVIAAGQVVNVTNLIHFGGGKISIGIRWKNRPVKFKVRIVGTSLSNAIVSDITVLDAYSQRQNVVAELKQKKSAVYIENLGNDSETLEVVTVTEFTGDSLSPTDITEKREYLGLSSEPKPTVTAMGGSIVPGSTYLELDTGNVFYFYNGDWRLFT